MDLEEERQLDFFHKSVTAEPCMICLALQDGVYLIPFNSHLSVSTFLYCR